MAGDTLAQELYDPRFKGGLTNKREEIRAENDGAAVEWFNVEPGLSEADFTNGFSVEIQGPVRTPKDSPTDFEENR